LTALGHAVVGIASTCEEALQLAEYHRPDIVLMDYSLKGQLNGASAARELNFSKVRIIFLTAHLAEAVGESYGIAFDFLPNIAFDFLPKPVRRDDLRQMIESTGPLPLRGCA
jgi:two-component SAPR family response regulator